MTIEKIVDRIEAAFKESLSTYQLPENLYDPVHYVVDAGGKRIRPVLSVLAYQTCGGSDWNILPAAVAVELLHTFTLVHDDIMDRSPTRRGRPTVHMRWDESAAILSGDVMIGIALRLLTTTAQSVPQPIGMYEAFATGLVDVCEGQAQDLAFQQRRDVTTEEYFDMITKKTAKLLEMAVTIGARAAGASDVMVHDIRTFARGLGIAFQLQDDILDVVGSPDFGKTPGGDIVEGKRTWLILTADKRANERHHRALLDAFWSGNGLDRSQIGDVIEMFNDLNIISDARSLVERYTQDAFEHLERLPDSSSRRLLSDLGHTLMGRAT